MKCITTRGWEMVLKAKWCYLTIISAQYFVHNCSNSLLQGIGRRFLFSVLIGAAFSHVSEIFLKVHLLLQQLFTLEAILRARISEDYILQWTWYCSETSLFCALMNNLPNRSHCLEALWKRPQTYIWSWLLPCRTRQRSALMMSNAQFLFVARSYINIKMLSERERERVGLAFDVWLSIDRLM